MQINALSYSNTKPENMYLYNNKELTSDFGLDWYEYGARMYDAEIARFPSLDPKADEFAFVSPYNYAENRPIDGIDLWGLQYTSANGKFYGANNQDEFRQKHGSSFVFSQSYLKQMQKQWNETFEIPYPSTKNNNVKISQGSSYVKQNIHDELDVQMNIAVDIGLQIGADFYKKGARLDIVSVELGEISASSKNGVSFDYIGNGGTAEITNDFSFLGFAAGQTNEVKGYGTENHSSYVSVPIPILKKANTKINPNISYNSKNDASIGFSAKASYVFGIKIDVSLIYKK